MSDQEPNGDKLINFIATTVETMNDRIVSIEERMATKDDLSRLEERMATKDDLSRLESKVDVGLTTIRGDFEQVHLRFDTIERTLSTRMGQIENEVSRLRSVVYLLVKDKPDMLRLLGQSLLGGESRP